MDAAEDGDLRLQRAFSGAVIELNKCLHRFTKVDGVNWTLQMSYSRQKDYEQIVKQLNLLQEDPQLLDPHLRTIMPPLTELFLAGAAKYDAVTPNANSKTFLEAMSVVIYTLCKTRGEKIISGFFDNSPRYLPVLLKMLVTLDQAKNQRESTDLETPNPWEQRYVTILWLAHLMLTPFDLKTISPQIPTKGVIEGMELPLLLPEITAQLVKLNVQTLSSPSKERDAAAKLLTTLCLRPDMLEAGLLDSMMNWTLARIAPRSRETLGIYQVIGILTFLNGIVNRGDKAVIAAFLPKVQGILSARYENATPERSAVTSTAITKKLFIKLQRNVVVKLLLPGQSVTSNAERISKEMLDHQGVLEESINHLLESMGDRETQVRFAASKALSTIAQNLDSDMANEVVEAILEAYTEDVVYQRDVPNLTRIDALRWHALTLTLGHMLFRKVVPPSKLSKVLEVLSLALNFQQRSVTGIPIGSNVRDAANFGLWSLARRYSTKELAEAKVPASLRKKLKGSAPSVHDWTAARLVAAACLDPVGNVRRGSSAALQELIGRHPNTIESGIPLVQIVDYHAVALRGRAIMDVGVAAAQQGKWYWDAILKGLHGWTGIRSPDRASRNYAGIAFGILTSIKGPSWAVETSHQLLQEMDALVARDVEGRHGLAMALVEIANSVARAAQCPDPAVLPNFQIEAISHFAKLWRIFDDRLAFVEDDFTNPSLQPDLTAEIVAKLCAAVSQCCLRVDFADRDQVEPTHNAIRHFNRSLTIPNVAALEILPQACALLCQALPPGHCDSTIRSWLQQAKAARSADRSKGSMIAVSAAWTVLHSQDAQSHDQNAGLEDAIRELLIERAADQDFEIRAAAVHSLIPILEGAVQDDDAGQTRRILSTLLACLNDYEYTERGDTGSVVRVEAIDALRRYWRSGGHDDIEEAQLCEQAIYRLALERLDRVRLRAISCLVEEKAVSWESYANLSDVSTYQYFANIAQSLLKGDKDTAFILALLEGFSSSTGAASDAVLQASRAALFDALDMLPVTGESGPSLMTVATCMLDLLARNLSNDRVLLPLLETIAFLLDSGVLYKLTMLPFKWRTLLSLVQKAHFKSSNISKITVAFQIYRGLAVVEAVRGEVVAKLCSMLWHPFIKVRVDAVDALYLATDDESLMELDCTKPTAKSKALAQRIKEQYARA